MSTATKTTRLFTVRVWQQTTGDDQDALAWRGKVQALPEGDAYYFRDWTGLIAYLEAMLGAGHVEPSEAG